MNIFMIALIAFVFGFTISMFLTAWVFLEGHRRSFRKDPETWHRIIEEQR